MKNKIPRILVKDLKIKGKKINLRPLKITDAQEIFSIVQDKAIQKNTLIPLPITLKREKDFIRESQKNLKRKKEVVWGVEKTKNKKIIGCLGLHKLNWQHQNAEIGYWLKKEERGQGLTPEAVKMVLNFAFKKLKLHRVWAGAFLDNKSSQRVLEKTGFKKEGSRKEHFFRIKTWRDDVLYGILKKDFKSIKKP